MHIDKQSFRSACIPAFLASIAVFVGIANIAHAQSNPSWGPKWTRSGELVLPNDYHEWIFLGSPLTPNALNGGKAAFPEYHNVYVQPEAYKSFRKTGEWPQGTILLKELQLTRPAANADGSSVEVSGRGFFPEGGHDRCTWCDSNFSDYSDLYLHGTGVGAKPGWVSDALGCARSVFVEGYCAARRFCIAARQSNH